MANVDFEPNKPGIEEICKSGVMQAALLGCAQKLVNAANMRANPKHAHVSHFEIPPYAAHVDVLDHTAVGAAHTNGKVGAINEARTFDLARQCH